MVIIVPAVYSLKTGKVEWLATEKVKPAAQEKVNPPKAEPKTKGEPIPAPTTVEQSAPFRAACQSLQRSKVRPRP